MMWLTGVLVLFGTSLAGAHETGVPHEEAGWTFAPSITVPLAAVTLLYLVGVARLWGRAGQARGVSRFGLAAFLLGIATLVGALVSPLHDLSERSFALHMIEHELLMAAAAPLLAFSQPGPALLWGIPRRWRAPVGGLVHTPIGVLWRWAARPFNATLIHGIAIWLWHVPVLFEAAVSHEAIHWLQHASFLGTGILFWWALFRLRSRTHVYGVAVADLFLTSMHTGILGALLVVSRRLWFALPDAIENPLHLSALQDQQLAGLLMWVPGSVVYVGGALYFAGLWITESGRRAGPRYDNAATNL